MSLPTDLPATNAPASPASLAPSWLAVDRFVGRLGDRLNPILVKETRQALKSRQFSITFGLLLLCGWAWSIMGVAIIGPDIWYGAHGSTMFFGYYVILALPLLVIVPFGAFRSIAGEQEDRTYELMSITTLGPRQIVRGKLGSAVVQMLVYLSAISPCLGFTYMLRGIDFPTILYILFYAVFASLGLSVIGLLIGTLSTEKHWQVVLSVLLIAGLLFALGISMYIVAGLLAFGQSAFGEKEFWQFNAALLSIALSYMVLLFYAAAAQITFASDNRAARLRATMLAQHALLTGWMAWLWISPAEGDGTALIFYMMLIGMHWWAMGALMTGESPDLSPRVRRRLPQSFLGRVFLTWFNPGPGTGLMLAVASLGGVLVSVAIAAAAATLLRSSAWLSDWDPDDIRRVLIFGVLGLSYVTIYLGLGLLILRALRKVSQVGVLLSVLIQVLLVLIGCLVPMIIQAMLPTWRFSGYTLAQISNAAWTLIEMGKDANLPDQTTVLLVFVPGAALLVFFLNLPGIGREVRNVRIAKPKRVVEEDAALEAIKHPPQPVKTSPWD